MATSPPFTKTLTVADIPPPCKSVGAHLAAKLDRFLSDERTLTDELCDMLCIWLGHPGKPVSPSGLPTFTITLSKTTPAVEVVNGADLELKIGSPLGVKRCLLQAKVLDPMSNKLRCDDTGGWRKLRKQLKAARASVGSLAFLLVYVPGRLLNGQHHGFSTYEQAFVSAPTGSDDSCYGATVIPVEALLNAKGHWRSRKWKVPRAKNGVFKSSIPLWQFLMELLLCARGRWDISAHGHENEGSPAFRQLAVAAGKIEPAEWLKLQEMRGQWLNQTQRGEGEV